MPLHDANVNVDQHQLNTGRGATRIPLFRIAICTY